MAQGAGEVATNPFDVLRGDLKEHSQNDREDFKAVNDKIDGVSRAVNEKLEGFREDLAAMKETQDQYVGGLSFVKWTLGLGIPAILACLLTLLTRHP